MLTWVDNRNSWIESSEHKPDWADLMERCVDVAKILTASWGKVMYESAGETEIPAWENMNCPAARRLHRGLRRAIRDYIPRQIRIDDFWMDLKRSRQEFTKSSDVGYPSGCWQTVDDLTFIEDLTTSLVQRLGKLLMTWFASSAPSITGGPRCGATTSVCGQILGSRRDRCSGHSRCRVPRLFPPLAVGEPPIGRLTG